MNRAAIGERACVHEGIGEDESRVVNARIPQCRIAYGVVKVRHPCPDDLVIDADGHIVRVKSQWLDVHVSCRCPGCGMSDKNEKSQAENLSEPGSLRKAEICEYVSSIRF